MLIQLQTGTFEGEPKLGSDGNSLDKKALLVYPGKFMSLNGEVEIKDEDIDKLATNHNSLFSKLGRLASGDVPMKHYPPIQLDHSTSAKDTVGRLVGDLEVGTHQLEDGTSVKALYGNVRVLGKENVERVQDGRWTHLSIGADLETHKLSELTITPFPAAADASLLSKHNLAEDDDDVNEEDVIGYLDNNGKWTEEYNDSKEFPNATAAKNEAKRRGGHYIQDPGGKWLVVKTKMSKLSKGDEQMGYGEVKEKMGMYSKCKAHLTEVEKMSEEDAEKKLASLTDEEVKKMADGEDERQKKLAADKEQLAEEEKKKVEAMKGQKEGLLKMAKQMRETQSKVELAAKKHGLQVRLSKLRADTKITPAEIKKIDLDKLAKESEATVNAVFETYEKREPQVLVGLYGSTKALSAAQIESKLKQIRMTRMELESRLNMPSKKADALKQLAALDEAEREVNVHIDNVPQGTHPIGGDEFEAAHAEYKRLTDEGKHDEAKEHLKKYMTGLMDKMKGADTVVSDADPGMSSLAEDVKKMQTNFDDFVKLAAPAFGIKAEELA